MNQEQPAGSSATPEGIRELARQIGDRFHPDRVLLFGSWARGSAGPDSDVDLLVIMDYEGSNLRQALRVRRSVDYDFPLDLIVRSSEEVRRRVRLGDGFLRDILREGRVLYERSDACRHA